MAENNFILKGPRIEIPDYNNLGQYLLDCLRQRDEDDVITIDAVTEKVQTCGELLKDVLKTVLILNNYGLKQNDVVAIISENNIKYQVPVMAAFSIGVMAHLLNPMFCLEELRHALEISRPKIVFCSCMVYENVQKLMDELKFIKTMILIEMELEHDNPSAKNKRVDYLESLLSEIGTVDYDSFEMPSFDVSEQGALILQSSGTTGMPKGVVITHQNFRQSCINLGHQRYLGANPGDTIAIVIPVFHIFGLLLLFTTITRHTKAVILQKYQSGVFLSAIERFKVNKLQVVPTLFQILTVDDSYKKYDLSSIEDILLAGAASSSEEALEVKRRLPNVRIREAYGLTEASGACTYSTNFPKEPNCVGYLIPNLDAKVCDTESGASLNCMEIGELCFRGAVIMKNYIGIPHQSRIVDDGFFYTGDLGYYDKDGLLYVIGRIKDIFKYKGFQVSPYEIERLLLTHSGIEECAVIGIPDKKAGQLAMGFVVRRKDCNVTEAEVVQFVADRISMNKRLHGGVQFVDSIPKTPTGKIQRTKLEEFWNDRAKSGIPPPT